MLEVAIGLRLSNDLEKRATELLKSIPDEQAAGGAALSLAKAFAETVPSHCVRQVIGSIENGDLHPGCRQTAAN